jgi:hypothetical protein
VKPKAFKIFKYMNQAIKESAKLNCGARIEQFLNYYTDLWTDVTHEHKNEEIWQTETQGEQEITKEDLQTALLKTKNGKSKGDDGINSELYKNEGDKFHSRLLKFLINIYKNSQIPNEWKISIIVSIYKNGDKRKPESYRGINLLNTCYKIFSTILDGKLKNITQDFLLECQNGFRKGRSCIDSAFCMKIFIEKRREFNLETLCICGP